MTRRPLTSAFTLVEMLFVITFFGMISALVGYMFVDVARFTNVNSAAFDLQRQARHQLDTIVGDVHDSRLVLGTYTIGSTTYTCDTASTLILQAPSFDAAGNALGTNDVILYRLAGASPPYQLRRTVIPVGSSTRTAVNDQVVASYVQSLTLVYYVDEGVIGDGVTKTFTLAGAPTNTVTATENGAKVDAGQLSLTPPQTLVFTAAPAAPDSVDVVYSVDPNLFPSQVTAINLDLKLLFTSSSLGRMSPTRIVEVASRCSLRNH